MRGYLNDIKAFFAHVAFVFLEKGHVYGIGWTFKFVIHKIESFFELKNWKKKI